MEFYRLYGIREFNVILSRRAPRMDFFPFMRVTRFLLTRNSSVIYCTRIRRNYARYRWQTLISFHDLRRNFEPTFRPADANRFGIYSSPVENVQRHGKISPVVQPSTFSGSFYVKTRFRDVLLRPSKRSTLRFDESGTTNDLTSL